MGKNFKFNLRAKAEERIKVLREGKVVKSDKPLEISKLMKEKIEKAKLAKSKQGSVKSTTPVSFKEMMLKKSEVFENIFNKNKKIINK